jgi:hypothetical protein
MGAKEFAMTKIDGKTQTSIPASVEAKMARGEPKRLAMSTGKKPVSTVRV